MKAATHGESGSLVVEKMLGFEKSFHPQFVQLAECTSEKPSCASSAVNFEQCQSATRNGTALVESAKRYRDLMISTVSLMSLLAALLLTSCGPHGARIQSGQEAPDETALVVLSGGSTISGDLVQDLELSNLPVSPASGKGEDARADETANGPKNATVSTVLERRLALETFAKEPAVADRVRLVLGWIEFFRIHSLLMGLNTSWSQLQVGRLEMDEAKLSGVPEKAIEEAKVSPMEFRLWRELLRSSFAVESFEPFNRQAERLDRLALFIAASQRPEDLQDVDRWLMTQ
jgi:hypothetical protein